MKYPHLVVEVPEGYGGRGGGGARVSFHTQSSNISPWFITGFTDAEGSFYASIIKDKTYKTGWQVRLFFSIGLHKKDKALLEEIQKFFGVGKVYLKNKDVVNYAVWQVKDLQVIREHFEKYPLITKKHEDFVLWSKILDLIQKKEHITVEGLKSIVAIRASLNIGLSEGLKASFPTIVPVNRPNINNIFIPDPTPFLKGVGSTPRGLDPNWVAGFSSGEGCFLISIFKDKTLTGFVVRLRFNLTQHTRDTQLIQNLVDFLGCGRYVAGPKGYNHCEFIVSSFSDITKTLIPFFEKYPIKGYKNIDFYDFCRAAKMMQNKEHLTLEGLEKIRLIKSGMNRSRNIQD